MPKVVIERVEDHNGDETWSWREEGEDTLYHSQYEDNEAAEQAALDELGSGQVDGFIYPEDEEDAK